MWVGVSVIRVIRVVILLAFLGHALCTIRSGISSILLTGLFYGFLWVMPDIRAALFRHTEKKDCHTIPWHTVVLILLAFELLLRFGFRYNLTYPEQNGQFFYTYTKFKEAPPQPYIFGSSWYFTNKPGSRGNFITPEYSYPFTCNAFGFRDTDFRKYKGDTALLFFFGDSFTEGLGAPPDSTCPKLLQHYLSAGDALYPVRVFNFGKAGSDVFFEHKLLEKFTSLFCPKTAIFMINASDILDVATRGGSDRFRADGKVRYKRQPVYLYPTAFSYLYRFLLYDVLKIREITNPPSVAEFFSGKDEPQVRAILDTLEQCILETHLFCRENQIRDLYVFQPHYLEIQQGYQLLDPLLDKLKKQGILVLDLRKAFEEKGPVDQKNYAAYYWLIDQHFNSKGYDAAAYCIADKLLGPN